MMSLTETSALTVVKTQYHYKTKAHAGLFFTLIAVQLLAFLLSLNGVGGSSGGSSQGIFYTIKYITGDMIIVFTLIWAFSIGISMANNGFKTDFTFVSNRLSSHLSSLAFLLTAAVIGGVTATLCGLLLRVVLFFSHGGVDAGPAFWIAPSALLSGIFAATLYAALLSIIGYSVGMLTQRHPAFVVLLPGLFFGTLFVEARSTGEAHTLISAIEWFSTESSHALLALKVVLVSAIIFGCVILLFNRMEVRKWQ
ncbi:hypothetical protein Desgi_0228 [Desulfoscipio gibsoniae DSM 7213]|uniref:ABC-2 family transporter protein n=1 Tax=Desulfoscipio gibsoniae DSM 7213 TaxID=767817 RepID=R4KDR8_9FIRM|nr:hypothetical protein Desgi_0228 [Desulfoscipio gibsoniae DSM 7213]